MAIGGEDDPSQVDLLCWERLGAESGLGGALPRFVQRWSSEILAATECLPARGRAGGLVASRVGGDRRRLPGTSPPLDRRQLGRLARRDQQVVEELGRQVGLEHAGVDLLQGDVAAEGEAAPAAGDRFGLGARLDRAQAPAPGVGEQLLAADVALLEAGARAAGGAGRRGRRRGRRPRPRARGRGTARPRRRRAARAPIARRQSGASDQAGALRQRRQAVAVARGLAGEGDRPARAAGRGGIRRRPCRGRGCGGGRRGRRRGRSSRPRRAAPRPRSRPSPTSSPSASAVAARRSSIPGEMSVAVSRSITPSWTQVEREVAGAGADLERVAEARARRARPAP